MISIIVPIYNTEKYLDKCLDSIRNQTYTDFEVIMVDDGSTDGSAEICKDFSVKDQRFQYYYKENGGVSSARNYGCKYVKGDYTAFIDSDDTIDKEYLEILACYCCKGYDIIQCGMRLIRNGNTTELVPDDNEYNGLDFKKLVLKRDFPIFLFQATFTKLYRSELIKSVRFDEDVSKSEDCLFNTQILPLINSVKTINSIKYNYFQDHSYLSKQIMSFDKVFQCIRIGNITSEIRYEIIVRNKLDNDLDILKGFQTAICIIYISNAHEIETNNFSKDKKKKLYDFFFSAMDYPINLAIEDFEGTDKRIALASAKKDSKTISRIYKLRKIKSKLIK